MIQDSKIAYSEIYAIINLMEDQFIDKVPKKIKDFCGQITSSEYAKRQISQNRESSKIGYWSRAW